MQQMETLDTSLPFLILYSSYTFQQLNQQTQQYQGFQRFYDHFNSS